MTCFVHGNFSINFRASWADSNSFPYWISHGTLIGWHWNKQILPWDVDIDLQIHGNMLYDLEQFHNVTVQENVMTHLTLVRDTG